LITKRGHHPRPIREYSGHRWGRPWSTCRSKSTRKANKKMTRGKASGETILPVLAGLERQTHVAFLATELQVVPVRVSHLQAVAPVLSTCQGNGLANFLWMIRGLMLGVIPRNKYFNHKPPHTHLTPPMMMRKPTLPCLLGPREQEFSGLTLLTLNHHYGPNRLLQKVGRLRHMTAFPLARSHYRTCNLLGPPLPVQWN
jgi:hypothetical protein